MLTIARRSLSVGRPPLGDGVTTSGVQAAHGSLVRSVASFVEEDRRARCRMTDCSSLERHGCSRDTTHPDF